MRIISLVAIALVPLALAHCTALPRTDYHWVKAGGDMPTLSADWRDCVRANSLTSRVESTTTADGGQVLHADGVDPDRAVACMKGRGWMLDGVAPG